jgi:hypothetical protein
MCDLHHFHKNSKRASKHSRERVKLMINSKLKLSNSTIQKEIQTANLPNLTQKQLCGLKYRLKKKCLKV